MAVSIKEKYFSKCVSQVKNSKRMFGIALETDLLISNISGMTSSSCNFALAQYWNFNSPIY